MVQFMIISFRKKTVMEGVTTNGYYLNKTTSPTQKV
jgi:hypothetical protein